LIAADGAAVIDRFGALVSGPVRAGTDADAIGGIVPRWVVTPGDTAETAALLGTTSALGLAVVARGAGTTLSWGAPPVRVDVVVDTTALSGIVEHEAGDLVVVVRAGTPLVELQSALAPAGQRLALDGEHGPATIGGLLAHGVSGPSRLLHGTLRDLLIGATMVRADGVTAHSGGKVVKNVAGFDLGKLLHGSWGTLGIVTEAVFRLHPRPPVQRWVTATVADPAGVGAAVQRVLGAQVVPAALELDRPSGGPTKVAVMLEGPEATVETRAGAVAALLGADATATATAPPWWGRRPGTPGDGLVRVTAEITGLAALLTALEASAVPLHTRGSGGVGSLLLSVPAGPDVGPLVSSLRRDMGKWGGSVVVIDGPLDHLAGIDRWGPVPGLDLMMRIKDRFDPGHLLAPGRFVGGI
jgi:glycolate oxidase FAD binding subunit